VKLLIDMMLSPSLARWLEGLGYDAVHASEIGMSRASDGEILTRASDEGRVVITADLDYPRLLAAFGTRDTPVILIRGGQFGDEWVKSQLEHLFKSVSEAEIVKCLMVIERHRVRKRQLPI
jgi:predicted nuclease of predicted toxin-antitoxin system